MDVHFILVDGNLAARQGGEQTPQDIQTPGFCRRKPRAVHARTGIGPPRPNLGQGSAHGRHMDAHPGLTYHRLHQHLARPGRPPPTMLLGIGTHEAIQKPQVIGAQLLPAVVFAAIPERRFPAFPEVPDHPIDGGIVNLQHRLNFPSTATMPNIDNDQITHAYQRLPAVSKPLQKALLDEVTGSGQNKRHGNSSLGLVGPGYGLGFPFFYALPFQKPLFDSAAELRTVI